MRMTTVERVVLGVVVVLAVLLIAYTVYRHCHTSEAMNESFAASSSCPDTTNAYANALANEYVLGGSDAVVPKATSSAIDNVFEEEEEGVSTMRNSRTSLMSSVVSSVPLSPTSRFHAQGVSTDPNACASHTVVFVFDVPYCGNPSKLPLSDPTTFFRTPAIATFSMTVHYTYKNPSGQRIAAVHYIETIPLKVDGYSQNYTLQLPNAIDANTARVIKCIPTYTSGNDIITLHTIQFVKTMPSTLADTGYATTLNGTAKYNTPLAYYASPQPSDACGDRAIVRTSRHGVFYGVNAEQTGSNSVNASPLPLPEADHSDTQSCAMELLCFSDAPPTSIVLAFAYLLTDASGAVSTSQTAALEKAAKNGQYPKQNKEPTSTHIVRVPVLANEMSSFTIALARPYGANSALYVASNITMQEFFLSSVPMQLRGAVTPAQNYLINRQVQIKTQASPISLKPSEQTPSVYPHTVYANDLQAVVTMMHVPQYGSTSIMPSTTSSRKAQPVGTSSYRAPTKAGFASTHGWYCCGGVSPSTLGSPSAADSTLLTLVVTYTSSDRLVFTIMDDGHAYLRLNKTRTAASSTVATAYLSDYRAGMGVSWMVYVYRDSCYIVLNANSNRGIQPNIVGQPPSTFTPKNPALLSKLYYHKNVTIAKQYNDTGNYPPIQCITTRVPPNATMHGTFYTSIQAPPVPEVANLWQSWDRQVHQAKIIKLWVNLNNSALDPTLNTSHLTYEGGISASVIVYTHQFLNSLSNKHTLSDLFNKPSQFTPAAKGARWRVLFETDVFQLVMMSEQTTGFTAASATVPFNLALFTRSGTTMCYDPLYFAADTALVNNSNAAFVFQFTLVGAQARLCLLQQKQWHSRYTLVKSHSFNIPKAYIAARRAAKQPLVTMVDVDPTTMNLLFVTDRATCSQCNPLNASAKASEGCEDCVSMPRGDECNGITSFGAQPFVQSLLPFLNTTCTGITAPLLQNSEHSEHNDEGSQCQAYLSSPLYPKATAVSYVPPTNTKKPHGSTSASSDPSQGTCVICENAANGLPVLTKQPNAKTYFGRNNGGLAMQFLASI